MKHLLSFSLAALLALSLLAHAQSNPPTARFPSNTNAPGTPGSPTRPLGQSLPAMTPPLASAQIAVGGPVVALPVQSMKMLTATAGWVSTGSKLLVTTDSGADWKDVSPPDPSDDRYANVYFLDPQNGWVLLAHSDNQEDWTFSVALTEDGGVSWQTVTLPEWIYDKEKGQPGLVEQGVVAFANRDHGWISLGVEGNTLFSSSTLLITSNGGRTWEWTKDEPEGRIDAILAVSNSDVWMISHPGGESRLNVTRDGGSSFQEVALPAPAQIAPDDKPRYDLPIFTGQSIGYEVVNYSGPEENKSASVLFKTKDRGTTWAVDRILSKLDKGEDIHSTVKGAQWVLPVAAEGTSPGVLAISEQAVTTVAPEHRRGAFGRCAIDFATPSDGWIDCNGQLNATPDGGSTWTNITPRIRNGALTHDAISPRLRSFV